MNAHETFLSHEELLRIMHYDLETGVFRWRVGRGGNIRAGMVAGTLCRGYVQLCFFKRTFAAHRVAWFYVHGKWPEKVLDHINMVRSDNRFVNLREVTRQQNNRNVGLKSHNKTGFKGVCRSPSGRNFRAYITVDYKTHYLGSFKTAHEAQAAYAAASLQHHKDFGRIS